MRPVYVWHRPRQLGVDHDEGVDQQLALGKVIPAMRFKDARGQGANGQLERAAREAAPLTSKPRR